MQRREFVRYLVFMGGMAALDSERLTATLRGLVRVDRAMIDQLGWWTYELASQWSTLPPAALRVAVGAHLAAIQAMLSEPLGPNLHRFLLAVGAHTAALAGLAARMVGNDEEARERLVSAFLMAQGARDDGLQALAHVWLADTFSAVQRGEAAKSPNALAVLDRAEDMAGPSAPASVRELVLLRQAEEHAAAGDVVEAGRYVDRAATAASLSTGIDPGLYGIGWGGAIAHGLFGGNVALLSGRPDSAVVTLGAIHRQLPATYMSARSSVLADLGAAHARLGELDAAVSFLTSAWKVASAIGHQERLCRVRGVRRHDLARWSSEPAVRRLDEALNATV